MVAAGERLDGVRVRTVGLHQPRRGVARGEAGQGAGYGGNCEFPSPMPPYRSGTIGSQARSGPIKAVCFPCAVEGRTGGLSDGMGLDQPDGIWTIRSYSSGSGKTVAPGEAADLAWRSSSVVPVETSLLPRRQRVTRWFLHSCGPRRPVHAGDARRGGST